MNDKVINFRMLNTVITACASAVLLAACGGGSSAPAPTPAPVVDPATAGELEPDGSQAEQTPTTPAPAPTPVPTPVPKVSALFTASSAEIANPERGFYRWTWTPLDQFSAVDGADAYANGYRVLYAMVRIDAYKNGALPDSFLTALRTGFDNARQSGVKIIPRFVYNYPSNETEYLNVTDAPLNRVLGHIAQLKPVLQDNADVIAFLQAGFIGAWGEWHTSSNDLTSDANSISIRDALLDALPQNQFVQFRYPSYVMAWSATPPAESSAFNGSTASRASVHNDCFLASATDVGTYSGDATIRQQQRDYVAALSKVTPFGGETCNPAADPSPVPRTSCDDILTEGRRFSLTYLNDNYYTDIFHNRWKQDGCYDEVKRSMGYRLQFASAEHATTASAGSTLAFRFTVNNVGWARVYKPRSVAVLLKHRTTGNVVKLATSVDPRSWTPGNTFNHDLSVTVAAGTPAGEYDVHLALPDGASQLRDDARFAVRPANADNVGSNQGWDASLGAFRIGTRLTIK